MTTTQTIQAELRNAQTVKYPVLRNVDIVDRRRQAARKAAK